MLQTEFVDYFDGQNGKDKVFYFERNLDKETVEMKSCDRDQLSQVFNNRRVVFDTMQSVFPVFWVSA